MIPWQERKTMQTHIVKTMAPDGRFTRNSEGAFLRLKDGRILFIYSRFTQSFADDAPSDLAAMFSADEGETWTEPVEAIAASRYGAKNVMSVSLLRMRNGDVGLFYIVKQSPGISRILLSRSSDEGRTWYRHTECTLPERRGYYVLNNDRVERLRSGRIIVPLALHRSSPVPEGGAFIDSRSAACFVYSDDDGETWKEAPDIIFPPFTATRTGLQETGVIEKPDGILWAYNRTDKLMQYESFSFDGGMHWTAARPSRFSSPPSPMKIKRRPETDDLYAVWNPIPNYMGRCLSKAGWGRTPLVWAVSRDGGATWSDPHVIEDGPENGYCYPAIFFTNDGAMLISYCSGGPEDGICLAKQTLIKLAI